nr:unnamed protein product [Gossypium raimondii]
MADTLATLASLIQVNKFEYVKNREYPSQATENDKRTLKRIASEYVLDGEVLYKRRKDQVLLRCVDVVEAKKILEEVHEGICGTHANGFTVARQDWHEKLSFALLDYQTSVRTSTGATPFSLVYRMEAVLPIEVEIPSLRVLSELQLDEAKWVQSQYDQLNLIEEKRLRAIRHGKMYQKRMMRAYNKKAFSGGALILSEMDGKSLPNPVNADSVKKYFT